MPDLNSVPPSPHILPSTTSRQTASQQMPPPPPVPRSPSLNILPSNQNAVNRADSSSSLPSPQFPPSIPTGQPQPSSSVPGSGPGPIRHPRPLTAADLHSELEKEQEAVVNRLTRELSLLRAAQNASVVSDTSSTSATTSGPESTHLSDQQLNAGSGFSHPLTSGRRHHRTSSSTSTRSFTATAGSISAASLHGISSPAPIRPGNPASGISLSRQNSTHSRRSRAASPAPHAGQAPASQQQPPHILAHPHSNDPNLPPSYLAHRAGAPSVVHSTATQGSSSTRGGSTQDQLSPGIVPATPRYEETAFYRAELDSVRRENEALKRRVRDLERMVRDRRASDASRHSHGLARPRSESASTVASVSVAASATGASTTGAGGSGMIAAQRDGRERPRVASMLGVPEDEVRVGESAASAGLTNRERE